MLTKHACRAYAGHPVGPRCGHQRIMLCILEYQDNVGCGLYQLPAMAFSRVTLPGQLCSEPRKSVAALLGHRLAAWLQWLAW